MRFAVIDSKLVPEKILGSPISRIDDIPEIPLDPQFSFQADLKKILNGKQLLFEDVPFSHEIIQQHYEHGYVTYRKGLITAGKRFVCQRCGNEDKTWFAAFHCHRCNEECAYCRRCLMMGRVSECTPLVGWRDDAEVGSNGRDDVAQRLLQWDGSLSDGQKEAAIRVERAMLEKEELLVWAVCGAGKTEILFQGIEAAIAAGQRVCIATPRTDVVLELAPRLKAVFPNVSIAALYGGSEERHVFAALTISTTHQLLRFYRAFDTLIVDEVDAFPYSVDETLHYAVRQARKPYSAMIFLTATPCRSWQRECREGKRAHVTIPARFHRHPLPVPEFVWCGNWAKLLQKGRLPGSVVSWAKTRCDAGKGALMFIPRIELMEKMLPLFRKLHQGIESVHAEDSHRKEKVRKMREGKIPLLLTTTILERGVTFPNIDVAVLGAEAELFTESALVQIAGRAGRSASFPKGVVSFFHFGVTEEMQRARKVIQSMNKEAEKRCLVD
ncbi:DEAD/DEAH box helicase [Bacillus massilinigeriensis]|uniref:DEAD/DEAH box helicase n=1 Tax=Bacillus mediterraneensis TaxID=1805474 RepID=UPI00093A3062|nr:DEAD/DEAH box helicase [Bacillus mediterraneensis]